MSKGTLYGIGVGPGDPELLTLKAVRLIQQVDVICYLTNAEDQTRIVGDTHGEGHSQARAIASEFIDMRAKKAEELKIPMAYSQNRLTANGNYDFAAHKISKHLDQSKDVAFICEGDPLFFGSYAYLQERLCEKHTCISVPGICSPNAAGAAAGIPLAMQNESYAVLSGRLTDQDLSLQLKQFDNLVIMKAGRSRSAILNTLKRTERFDDAVYVEYATRSNQKIVPDLSLLDDEPGPYFSLFIVSPHIGKRKWA